MGADPGGESHQLGRLHRQSSGGATVSRLLEAKRSSASRQTGNESMILTPEEIAFLDVYCYEGTQPPFGGPATDEMAGIGVHDGDTLNIQWAYLRDKPPTGLVIGRVSKVAPPLPWPNREMVLRRDAEIAALRQATKQI